MAQLIGDLVAVIDADSSRFEQGIQRSNKQLAHFEKSSTAALLSSNRFRGGLTQASFAVDDFFGVLAAGGGVGAALRSTSNNIGTLVTAINPLAGIATTLGITLGSLLIPKLFSTGDAADKAGEDLETFEERMRRLQDEQNRLKALTDQSVRIATLFDSSAIDVEIRTIEERLKELTRDRDMALRVGFQNTKAEQEIAQLNAQLARLEINQGLAEFNRQLEQTRELGRIGDIDSLDSLNDRLEDSRQQLEAMQRETQAIARTLGELERIDPSRSLPEFDDIFAVQDERLRQMKELQQQIEALQKRRDELEFDKSDKELRGGIEQDLENTLDQFDALEKLEADAERFRDAFALDIETDPLKRSLLQIEQEFDKRIDEIRDKFDGALELDLIGQAEAAKQAKIDKALGDEAEKQRKLDAKRDQFAGFAERGTSEAFSAILKASRGDGELTSIAKTNQQIAKNTAASAKAAEKQNMPKPKAETAILVERF